MVGMGNRIALMNWSFFWILLVSYGCQHKLAQDPDQEWFDASVSAVKQGKSDRIDFYDTPRADERLKSITGLSGVKAISFSSPCDVTEEGIKVLPTLPDLTWVTFYHISIKEAYFDQLQSCEALEKLILNPSSDSEFELRTALALPKLKELHINSPSELDLKALRTATTLEKLTLVGRVSETDLRELKESLPDCKISIERHW